MGNETFSPYYVECQLVNVEEITQLENYHLANIKVIINSGKKHQWVLTQISKSGVSTGISVILITKEQSNFTGEKWGRHYLNEVIKVTTGTQRYGDKVASGVT